MAELRCVEARTGRVVWQQPEFGVAHLILADEKLLILKVSGELILAEPSPRAFRPVASARVADATTRALPALSNGRLCFRTNSGDGGTLFCAQVGP
jgi:hypothetical protein